MPQSAKSLIDSYLTSLPRRDPADRSEIVFGSGSYRYRLDNEWMKLPPEVLTGVLALATDGADRVYAFGRTQRPVYVFDRDGNLVDNWGEGIFTNPHGIFVGPDGMIYLADDGDHTVRKCTPQGKVVLTIGEPHEPAPYMSGRPFCRCTDIALSPSGDIYVTDGYFNASVHKFSPDGKLLFSWGRPGNDAGEFNIVHSLICDDEGWVYVADRENYRIQVFDGNGKFETQWHNMHRPMAIDRSVARGEELFYVAEGEPVGTYRHAPGLGPSVLVLNRRGERLAKLGNRPTGHDADQFLSCHAMCSDSHGDIYVGDNALSRWRAAHPGEPPGAIYPLRKLVRLD